jgi:uncharacterized protein YoxC
VSIGDIAGVIAALAFAYLVFRLGALIGKAGKVLDETSIGVHGLSAQTVPLLSEVTDTVASTNEQIVRLDTITANGVRSAMNGAGDRKGSTHRRRRRG